MITETLKLLLKYGTDLEHGEEILDKTLSDAKHLVLKHNTKQDTFFEKTPVGLKLYNTLLEGLGEVCRTLMLGGVSFGSCGLFDRFFYMNQIRDKFILIAEYSSMCGRSLKLLKVLVNALNTTQVTQLKTLLPSLRQDSERDFNAPFPGCRISYIKAAIRCASDLEGPLRLQQLPRKVIISKVSVCWDESTLGLSKRLQDYVQLHDLD